MKRRAMVPQVVLPTNNTLARHTIQALRQQAGPAKPAFDPQEIVGDPWALDKLLADRTRTEAFYRWLNAQWMKVLLGWLAKLTREQIKTIKANLGKVPGLHQPRLRAAIQAAMAHSKGAVSPADWVQVKVSIARAALPQRQVQEIQEFLGTQGMPGPDDRKTLLRELLGFQPQLLTLADSPLHPMCAGTITAMNAYLEGKHIFDDAGKSAAAIRQARRTYQTLRTSLQRLGDNAINKHIWGVEAAALNGLIGEITVPLQMLVSGAPYTQVADTRMTRALKLLNERLFAMLSPVSGPDVIAMPGGKFERKIYLGSTIVGPALLNWYLNLLITTKKKAETLSVPGTGGAGLKVSVAADGTATGERAERAASESGSQGPSVELAGTEAGTSVKASAKDPAKGTKASVEGSPSSGPKLTAEKEKSLGGGAKAGFGGSVDKKSLAKGGPELKGSISGGGTSTEIRAGLDKKGKVTGPQVSAEAAGWTNTIKGGADGIKMTSSHKGIDGGDSVRFEVSMGKAVLMASAPELNIYDVAAVKAGMTIEVVPLPILFKLSATQNEESLRQYQRYMAAWAAAYAAFIGAPLAAGGIAAAPEAAAAVSGYLTSIRFAATGGAAGAP